MDRQFSSIFLGVCGLLLMLLSLLRLTFDLPTLLIALVLGIVFVYSVLQMHGRGLIGFVMVGVIVLQAQWGLLQFVIQRDLGMHVIGESRIDVQRVAVAKFATFGHKLVRAYGPYAHANSFGGVVIVGLIVLGRLARLRSGLHQRVNVFWSAVFLVLLLGVLVSFSRAAYLSAALILSSGWYSRVQFKWVPLISFISILLFVPLIYERLGDAEDRGITARISAWEAWQEIVPWQVWWRGLGVGKYPETLQKYFESRQIPFEVWEIEPVHSVPLLAIAEWGWLLALVVMVGATVWVVRGGWAIAAIVPPLMFDHYFLTQVGPLMFLITLSVFWSARHRVRSPQSQGQP